MAAIDDHPFAGFSGHKYCQLLTFRRSGKAVNTPVWFTIEGERLLFVTDDPSGKVKRIRGNPHVKVAPSTVTGKAVGRGVDGRARILSDPRDQLAAERLLRERYGLFRKIWMRTAVRYFEHKGLETVWLEITPARRESQQPKPEELRA